MLELSDEREGKRVERETAAVDVVAWDPQPAFGSEDLLARAGAALRTAPANPAIVRRYRLPPDPLVRDSVRGYRTGRIDRVLNHIHAHFAEPITISQLADIAALSPSGLHRTFQRHTRQTVSQYLIRLRIGRACALLSSGDMPIGTIAGEVGYDSLANFNRQFKALKGTTPRAYRAAFLG